MPTQHTLKKYILAYFSKNNKKAYHYEFRTDAARTRSSTQNLWTILVDDEHCEKSNIFKLRTSPQH